MSLSIKDHVTKAYSNSNKLWSGLTSVGLRMCDLCEATLDNDSYSTSNV